MSKRISDLVKLGLALAAVLVLAGCQTVSSPVYGIFMQNVGTPGGGSKVGSPKEGKSCATSYFGVYAHGDASIKAAAEAGGITQIDHVDGEVSNLVVIGTYCTVVRGS